jgi:hypothetical protein
MWEIWYGYRSLHMKYFVVGRKESKAQTLRICAQLENYTGINCGQNITKLVVRYLQG